MKKLVSLLMVVLLCFSSMIITAESDNKDNSINNGDQIFNSGKMLETLNSAMNLADSNDLTDDQIKALNSASEKIIEEKTGIKVKATDGILYYDEEQANESLQMRNDDASKIIEERTGIKVKATDGILYYDTTKAKDDKLINDENDITIQATSIPTELNRNYPYEHDWSGTKNYSYSRKFFRLDAPETFFSSFADTPYHAEFYGTNGKYWFTIRGRERERRDSVFYSASTYLLEDLIDYYNASDYYIIMYNDASDSSAQEAYYSLGRMD